MFLTSSRSKVSTADIAGCEVASGFRRNAEENQTFNAEMMPSTEHSNFLSGANAEFIAELYARYLDDPRSVDESWRDFYAGLGDDAASLRIERAGPPWAPAPKTNGAAAA